MESIQHDSPASKSVKPRLGSLEKYVTKAHHGTSSLEQELMGEASAYHLQSSLTQKFIGGDDSKLKLTTCVKARLESIKSDFATLASRLTALEKSPASSSLGKLEAKMADLQPKCVALATKVGVSSDIESFSAKADAPLSDRINSLSDYLSHLHAKMAPLEEELIGTKKAMPVHVGTLQTIKAKIDGLEKVTSDLESRVTSLQNEV